MTVVVSRRLFPADRAASPYLDVPFEVPEGTSSVHVSLSYAGEGAVIDLGCAGPAGWRGWSGGARRRFTVTASAATPGYVAGPLEPGEWSVVLGLYRVPAEGVPVEVSVVLDDARAPLDPEPSGPPAPPRPPRRSLPAEAGLTWLACDFHAHTLHSDGSLGIAELASLAVAAGLDVLAVTDHNTVSHHASLPSVGARYGVTLLPGQEVTTDRGHANAFGPIPWVDFRQPPSSWVSFVESAGGLLSINHPLAGDCSWHHPLDVRPPLAEIFHHSWMAREWTGPLAWWTAWDLATVPISGSDFHSPADGRPLARPVTWVAAASPTVPDVMDSLRAGRTALAWGVDEPVLLRVDGELVAVGADGLLLADMWGRRQVVRGELARFPGADGPHRLETPMAAVVAVTP
ncbi:CehA/McbA family metallohydrolase [Jiangella rhizosphaerae]|uniref:PHP domain-containing protein n=1 Tax=Jiangella rhizosphaerae TaxID=2293569 RepID=A0A418KHF3_9ACTN|nr:CehA/McbA family metallohydrolase [Jiangella rhizosphaerae]RIQ11451.1 PHP domain-containing protein [Jiangella rhizosphaerae]